MTALSPNAPPQSYAPPGRRAEPFSEGLDHFRSIATMLELIDRLPDLADDIRSWRPSDAAQSLRAEAASLEAASRHALEAVVTGLNMLGVAAATLCENGQGQLEPDEILACQEIGAAMTSLFERAKALLQTEDAAQSTAARAELFAPFCAEPRLFPSSQVELTLIKEFLRAFPRATVGWSAMHPMPERALEELNAADARRAALAYVSEAFAEAVLDGIDVDAFADAALSAVFRELVANHGEDRAASLAEGVVDRIRRGDFSLRGRQ